MAFISAAIVAYTCRFQFFYLHIFHWAMFTSTLEFVSLFTWKENEDTHWTSQLPLHSLFRSLAHLASGGPPPHHPNGGHLPLSPT